MVSELLTTIGYSVMEFRDYCMNALRRSACPKQPLCAAADASGWTGDGDNNVGESILRPPTHCYLNITSIDVTIIGIAISLP